MNTCTWLILLFHNAIYIPVHGYSRTSLLSLSVTLGLIPKPFHVFQYLSVFVCNIEKYGSFHGCNLRLGESGFTACLIVTSCMLSTLTGPFCSCSNWFVWLKATACCLPTSERAITHSCYCVHSSLKLLHNYTTTISSTIISRAHTLRTASASIWELQEQHWSTCICMCLLTTFTYVL